MISTLNCGSRGAGAGLSFAGTERVAVDARSGMFRECSPVLNIDGGTGFSRGRRAGLPIVLLPLLSESLNVAPDIMRAVKDLQVVSGEFRVVVATELDAFASIRKFGWALSHVVPHSQRESRNQWADYVDRELRSVVETFGCSFVIDTGEAGISDRSWDGLLRLAKMHATSELAVSPVKSASTLHVGWRGWLNDVALGSSTHKVRTPDCDWRVNIRHLQKSSIAMVILDDDEDKAFEAHLAPPDWNVIRLSPEANRPSREAIQTAVLAILDAFSLCNAGLVLGLDESVQMDVDAGQSKALVQASNVNRFSCALAERRALAHWAATGQGGKRTIWTDA